MHVGLAATQDFLLLGASWEEKRKKRFKGPDYSVRTQKLRSSFPRTFGALDLLRATKAHELIPIIDAHRDADISDVVRMLREQKLGALKTAVKEEIMFV